MASPVGQQLPKHPTPHFKLLLALYNSGSLKFDPLIVEGQKIVGGGFPVLKDRRAPYDLNVVTMTSGTLLNSIVDLFAEKIQLRFPDVEMIVPANGSHFHIASAVAMRLTSLFDKEVFFGSLFNEKEVDKVFGGKKIVVLDIEAVAGFLVFDAIPRITELGGILKGVAFLCDRLEIRDAVTPWSVSQTLLDLGIRVTAIMSVEDLTDFLKDPRCDHPHKDQLVESMKLYLEVWGKKSRGKPSQSGKGSSIVPSTKECVDLTSESETSRVKRARNGSAESEGKNTRN